MYLTLKQEALYIPSNPLSHLPPMPIKNSVWRYSIKASTESPTSVALKNVQECSRMFFQLSNISQFKFKDMWNS